MALKNSIEGYSVIVFVAVRPDSHSPFMCKTPEDAKSLADDIERDLKGVMHRYRGAERPEIEPQISCECEHCGSRWTEASRTYNGGCCDKDQETEDQRLADAEANSQFGVGA